MDFLYEDNNAINNKTGKRNQMTISIVGEFSETTKTKRRPKGREKTDAKADNVT